MAEDYNVDRYGETVTTAKKLKRQREELNIDRLRFNFDQGARANRFLVNLFLPEKLSGFKFEGIRCISATLPGRTLETTEFSEYGATRKMPFQTQHDEATFTFLCDSSFADRFIIDAWQSIVYTGSEGTGNSAMPIFSYYNDYVGQVEITQLTRKGDNALKYTLYEAYPVAFAAQDLSWESTDEIMKFECTIAYRTFDVSYEKPSNVSGLNRGIRSISALRDLLGVFGNKSNTLNRFENRLRDLSSLFG